MRCALSSSVEAKASEGAATMTLPCSKSLSSSLLGGGGWVLRGGGGAEEVK